MTMGNEALIERLNGDRLKHIDYGIDLQRIIEALCRGGGIPEPQTGARYHYDRAVAFRPDFSGSRANEVRRVQREWRLPGHR
jgi:hypothetical protein